MLEIEKESNTSKINRKITYYILAEKQNVWIINLFQKFMIQIMCKFIP